MKLIGVCLKVNILCFFMFFTILEQKQSTVLSRQTLQNYSILRTAYCQLPLIFKLVPHTKKTKILDFKDRLIISSIMLLMFILISFYVNLSNSTQFSVRSKKTELQQVTICILRTAYF